MARTARSRVERSKRPLKRVRSHSSMTNQPVIPANTPIEKGNARLDWKLTRSDEWTAVTAAPQVAIKVGLSAVIVTPSKKFRLAPA
jgi:hypothetical protein